MELLSEVNSISCTICSDPSQHACAWSIPPRVNALKSDQVPTHSQKAFYHFENTKTKRFDELQKYSQRLESHPEILMRLPCPPPGKQISRWAVGMPHH